MHQSWLKNHMCVLGWISRSHARNGNEIQTSGHCGSAGNIDKLGFLILVNPKLVWNSWNLACYHGAASTYRGTNFVPFGEGLGICFLQTGASLKKARGSEREHVTFVCEMIYAAPPLDFLYRGNIELYECPVKFCNYSGFVWPSLYIIEFLDI